jgi:hypothetical protein
MDNLEKVFCSFCQCLSLPANRFFIDSLACLQYSLFDFVDISFQFFCYCLMLTGLANGYIFDNINSNLSCTGICP